MTWKTYRSRTPGPELVAKYFAKALEALQLLFSVAAPANAVRRNHDRKSLPITDGGSQLAVAAESRQSCTRGTQTAFSVPLVKSSVIPELDSLPFEMNPLSEAIMNVKAKWSSAGTGSLRLLLVMASWAIWAAPFALIFWVFAVFYTLVTKPETLVDFVVSGIGLMPRLLNHFAYRISARSSAVLLEHLGAVPQSSEPLQNHTECSANFVSSPPTASPLLATTFQLSSDGSLHVTLGDIGIVGQRPLFQTA